MEQNETNLNDNNTLLRIKNSDTKHGCCCGMTFTKENIAFFKSFLIYVVMLFGGAIFFYFMESPNEILNIDEQISDIKNNKEKIFDLLNKTIASGDVSKTEELFSNIQEYATGFNFEEEIIRKWTFLNSLLFSFTVLSTIGYGRYAPLTTAGRIFLMIYAIVGIPLTAICLSRAAERFIYLFKWIYQIRTDKVEKAFNYYDDKESGELDKEKVIGALQGMGVELSTHEQDDLWNIIDFDKSGSLDLEEFRRVVKDLNLNVTDAAGKKKEAIITVIAIITFLALGVLIFCLIEEWSPFISFYFLIVSLTTVGLGDFIPRTHTGGIILVIYAAIGLGLLATGLTVVESRLSYIKAKNEVRFENIRDRKNMEKQIKLIPKFASIPHKQLIKLMESFEVMNVNANSKIFEEGAKLERIYFLAKGKASLQRFDESDKREIMNAGSLFFESSLSTNSRTDYYLSDATVFATTEVKIQTLSYDEINKAITNDMLEDENKSLFLSHESDLYLDDTTNTETPDGEVSESDSMVLKETEAQESRNETNLKNSELLSRQIWSYGLL